MRSPVFAKHMPFYVAAVLAVFCAGVWSAVYVQAPFAFAQHPPQLLFAVLDVGQGDALYIESPTGVQVLVDGGPGDALLRALPGVMPALDRSIDAIIETHPDADHIGGFVGLLQRYEVGVFISPGIPKPTATARALEQEVSEFAVPRVIARRGMSLDIGGGARLDILYPDHDVSNVPSDKVNEGGIVVRLVYGQSEALLMADVGKGVETQLLLLDGEALHSDLLKVGHHGSRFSSGEEFVTAVSPTVALISVGAKNTYGHPTQAALAALQNVGANILRTDQKGTIRCFSDGAAFQCAGER